MHDRGDEQRPRWPCTLLATLPAAVLLAWQTRLVWPFFSDDAFISLRYSQRLLAGQGLSWTDGEQVEGYSNLLWVLACAGLGGLGIDLVTAARVLGGVSTAVAFAALAHAACPRDGRSTVVASIAPLLAASCQVLLGWTFGGLEGPLVFACLALGFGNLLRRHAEAPNVAGWSRRTLLLAGVPFAFACWTRPDAPLWVAAIAAALAASCRAAGVATAGTRALWFGALPAAAVALQLAFRLAWHGDVVPNTAHVKAGFAASALPAGLDYVGGALRTHAGLVLPAVVAAGWLRFRSGPSRAVAAWLGWPLVAWLLYLVIIGGDHFPGRRLLHGAVAPLVLLSMLWLLRARRQRWLIAGVLLGGAGWNVVVARTDDKSLELRGETWEWQGRVIGEALRAAFGEARPLVAVDSAGAIPFYSELPALDLLGLCDRTIAKTPPPAWLDTMLPGVPKPPGHLHGNGAYVFERAPDVLLFGPPPGRPLPVFVSGAELEEHPGFLERHRIVLLDLGTPEILPGLPVRTQVPLWVRLDGKVGITRHQPPDERGERIRIPAWLFGAFAPTEALVRRHQPPPRDPAQAAALQRHLAALVQWLTNPPAQAVPAAAGRLPAHVGNRLTTLHLVLAPGTYLATVVPARTGVTVSCSTASTSGPAGSFTVRVAAPHDLQLQIADDVALPCEIDRIELLRTDG